VRWNLAPNWDRLISLPTLKVPSKLLEETFHLRCMLSTFKELFDALLIGHKLEFGEDGFHLSLHHLSGCLENGV